MYLKCFASYLGIQIDMENWPLQLVPKSTNYPMCKEK